MLDKEAFWITNSKVKLSDSPQGLADRVNEKFVNRRFTEGVPCFSWLLSTEHN